MPPRAALLDFDRRLIAPTILLLCLVQAVLSGWILIQAQPLALDWLPVWTASRLIFGTPVGVYDFQALTEAQAWLIGADSKLRPAAYPPSALLLLSPLGQAPFWTAYGLLTGLSAAFAAGALALARMRGARLGAGLLILSPAVSWGALVGQAHMLTAGALTFGLLAAERRPRLSGAVLGLAMAIKPSLLLVAPLALLARGGWTAVAACAAAGALAVGASALAFGIGAWQAWIAALPRFLTVIEADPGLARCVISPTALAWALGLEGAALSAWQAAFAALGAGLAWIGVRKGAGAAERLAAAGAGCLLAAPYAMVYDAALLAPASVLLILNARNEGAGWTRAILAFLAASLASFAHIGPFAVFAFAAVTCGPALKAALWPAAMSGRLSPP